MLKNKKGTVLIATYIVLFVIFVTASCLFMVIITEKKSVSKETEGKKALSLAEAGLAYAYYESQNFGWQWYTHKWNLAKDKLLPLDPGDASYCQAFRSDVNFDGSGFYVANDGSFMVKAYPDQNDEDTTIVISLGVDGSERRAISYGLNRRGIYDFFYYSPYSIDLDNSVGKFPQLHGGSIHTNGNLRIDKPVRLENISELSTGGNGSIYYAESDKYPAPYYADKYSFNGGQNSGAMDGRAPMVRLDQPTNLFRDDGNDESGDFGYYWFDKYGGRRWSRHSYSNYFAHTNFSSFPNKAFRNTEWYFYGDKLAWNNVAPGAKDTGVSTSIVNDNTDPLNKHNTWVKPYLGENEDGDPISGPWEEIPAELNEAWEWSKYRGYNYGDHRIGGSEQPVTFYTRDNSNAEISVENTMWDIVNDGWGDKVVMVEPADLGSHPGAKSYWDMYKDPKYWATIGKGNYVPHLNKDILDGNYGSERSTGGKMPVMHTNTAKQSIAWPQFIKNSPLDGIVRDGNSGGEYLDPPEFDASYQKIASQGGLLIDLDVSFDGKYDDRTEWRTVLEKSVDNAVASLNAMNPKVAKKVKFVNTYTNQLNILLEIDLKEMQATGNYPSNGIVYSKVPLRLTNGERLPRKMANYGFTVLCEENLYLKGDFNTKDWVTSAMIGKKRVFTLSDDFNDPQVVPATLHYRDYPYMYVKDDGMGIYAESNPADGGGQWVHRSYLNYWARDVYPNIDDTNEQRIKNIIAKKDYDYQKMFNRIDTSGTLSATFSWAPSGESYTYGMMPNRVSDNHTFNALIACYRGTKGETIENWSGRNKYFNGAYFVLDKNGEFTADSYDLVDYEWHSSHTATSIGKSVRGRFRWDNIDYSTRSPSWKLRYDARFQTATRSPSDVFFGGAESLWAEVMEEYFYESDF